MTKPLAALAMMVAFWWLSGLVVRWFYDDKGKR